MFPLRKMIECLSGHWRQVVMISMAFLLLACLFFSSLGRKEGEDDEEDND